MNIEIRMHAQDLITHEAWLIDSKGWDDWLKLYSDDAVFWVPTWLDDEEISCDPNTQISAIYIEGKEGIRERIRKAMDPRSPASVPRPRTAHVLGPIQIEQIDDRSLITRCAWHASIYDPKAKRSMFYSGRYEHELRQDIDCSFKIKKKKIIIINDQIHSKLDFFYI